MQESILRIGAVKNRTGLSNTTLYAMMKNGEFPKPIPLGKQAKGWVSSEIDDWIQARISQRKAA
jgi:prophage regulatory protein